MRKRIDELSNVDVSGISANIVGKEPTPEEVLKALDVKIGLSGNLMFNPLADLPESFDLEESMKRVVSDTAISSMTNRMHKISFSEEELNKPLPPAKTMDELMQVFETHTPDELAKMITDNLSKALDEMEMIRDEKDVRTQIAKFIHHINPSTEDTERIMIETFVNLGDKK